MVHFGLFSDLVLQGLLDGLMALLPLTLIATSGVLGLAVLKRVLGDQASPRQRADAIPFRSRGQQPVPSEGDGFKVAKLLGDEGERAISRELRRHGLEYLHNVVLPAANQLTQIDHVVLAGSIVVCLEVKTWNGKIYGRQESPTWTKFAFGGGTRMTMQNPLRQNRLHIRALQSFLPGAEIRGLVVMAGRSQFKEDVPGVVTITSLVAHLRAIAMTNPATPAARTHWLRLEELRSSQDHERAKFDHASAMARRSNREFSDPGPA